MASPVCRQLLLPARVVSVVLSDQTQNVSPLSAGSEVRSGLIWLLRSVSTLLLKSSHTGFCVPAAHNNLARAGVDHRTEKALQARLVLRRQWGGEGGLARSDWKRGTGQQGRSQELPEWGHGKIQKKTKQNNSLAAFDRPSKLLW